MNIYKLIQNLIGWTKKKNLDELPRIAQAWLRYFGFSSAMSNNKKEKTIKKKKVYFANEGIGASSLSPTPQSQFYLEGKLRDITTTTEGCVEDLSWGIKFLGIEKIH